MTYKKIDLENDLSLTPDKVSGTINQDFQPEIGNKMMSMNTEIMKIQPSNKAYEKLSVKKVDLEAEALKLAQTLAVELQKNLTLRNPSTPNKDVEQPNRLTRK